MPVPPAALTPSSPVPAIARGDGRRIRVLVADDHAVVRQGLVQMLGQVPGLEVVGEAVDGCDAVEKTRGLHPDVVLIDLSMPRMDGLVATKLITSQMPQVRVIGLSMHAQENAAQQMAEAGASHYLVKDSPIEVIAAAIREVCRKA
jgi:DNA-binding NarL/FixJ family response regulator